MAGNLVVVGTELGGTGNGDYGVLCNDNHLFLNKKLYNLWLICREATVDRSKFAELLKTDEEQVEKNLSELMNLGLVIEWPKVMTEEFASYYSLIPRGYSEGRDKEGNYLLVDGPFSESRAISMAGHIIWTYSHPLFSLKTTAYQICEVAGTTEDDIYGQMLIWVPYLVKYGLATLQITLDKQIEE